MRSYKHLLSLIFCFLAIGLSATQAASPAKQERADGRSANRFNAVTFTPQPPLAVVSSFSEGNGGVPPQGLSGAFAGRLPDGRIFVAGGCNFPDTPAADGGKKAFYSDIYLLGTAKPDIPNQSANERSRGVDAASAQWHRVATLPRPLAYGTSVTTPEGVVCLGGTSDGSKSEVLSILITADAAGNLRILNLPNLPVALDNFAAAYGDGYIYIAAGQSHGVPNRTAFRLSWPLPQEWLDNHTGAAWEQLPDVPGPMRVQPCAAVQKDALGSNFYLLGGYNPTQNRAVVNGVCYDPRSRKWSHTAAISSPSSSPSSLALIGSSAVTSGAAHILCFGGVDKEIFERAISGQQDSLYLRHDASWYRFQDHILAYHTITNSWVVLPFSSPFLARAGSSLVTMSDGSFLIIDGELKPGVRSTDVTRVDVAYTAHFGWLNWAVLIFYLLGMVYLGYYFMRRASKSSDDFFKGGGRIPWWAAGISIFATMLSAITYMSIPAKAYATDWTYYPMQVCILLISFPVIKYYLPFFRRLNVTTAYEYLERRFNSATRILASVLFIVFMVARTALVLFLPSLAMTAVTGINIYICIALMALITILYCTMGGVEAVVWGDVIQGFILIGGAILAAVYLIVHTGEHGASDFWQIATDHDKFRLFLFDPEHPFDFVNATWWVVILGGLANNLISYTSDQTVIQRYLTTSDERSAARGILTNGIMSVVVTIVFFTIGTALYTFFKTHPAELDITMSKSDAIFPFFMMSQLPAGLAGLLIAAVFAATMSTIASNINSISTAFTVDLWSKWKGDGSVRTARISGIVAGLIGMAIACLMATVDIQSLLDYFNTILGLLSGAIGGLFIMGIFFPRIGSRAAIIGFICGTATVVYMNFCTHANFLLFGFVSMFVSVAVALAISFLWPQRTSQPGLTWSTLQKK